MVRCNIWNEWPHSPTLALSDSLSEIDVSMQSNTASKVESNNVKFKLGHNDTGEEEYCAEAWLFH